MLKFIRKNIFIIIIFIITLFLGFLTFLTFIDKSFIELTDENLQYLLVSNILLLLIFFSMIFIEIKNSIKNEIAIEGSRANRKYITFFSLFTLIPSILISVFSLFLFSFALEKYFDKKITTAVSNSYQLAVNYVSTVRNKVESDIVLAAFDLNKNVSISGWVRTFRANRFIALNDGSCLNNIQCVVDFEKTDQEILKKITTGAALNVKGKVIKSQGSQQSVEIVVNECKILGESNPELYPIQPKKHSFEFLRENSHLRTRTNTFSAVMRIRSNLSFAIHEYFKKNGFYYVHTPIITASDAEGAGEQFRVSTLDIKNPPLNDNGQVDFNKDFFGKETNLTVSGQLEAEAYAMSMGKVYTFGPTFRAENSNTSRHLSEFWMIEPEVAFMDIEGNMKLAEDFLKYVLSYLIDHNIDDLKFLESRLTAEEKQKPQNERSEMTLIEKLHF